MWLLWFTYTLHVCLAHAWQGASFERPMENRLHKIESIVFGVESQQYMRTSNSHAAIVQLPNNKKNIFDMTHSQVFCFAFHSCTRVAEHYKNERNLNFVSTMRCWYYLALLKYLNEQLSCCNWLASRICYSDVNATTHQSKRQNDKHIFFEFTWAESSVRGLCQWEKV